MSGPLVLGVDTSTVVTVGLAQGSDVLQSVTVDDRLAHVEQLTPMIRQALAAADVSLNDLDHLVVGLGPGPFTGLRVGIATARVLASVSRVPLKGVCSLDVLASQYAREHPPGEFLVATDARRKEVYWARYDATGRRTDGPRVCSPDELPKLPTVGPGASLYADRLDAVLGPRVLDPGVLASHGLEFADAGTEPLYLRRPDAALPTRRKSVLTFRADRGAR
ncbi:MAG: tRNA (adenosine(37)-N6)-threonylcarbamoyltransferase complex dimerization subunit type 1 TsaB [Propionibacteriaceae bacterium]